MESTFGSFRDAIGRIARESYEGESITDVIDRLDERLVAIAAESAPSTFKPDALASALSSARMPQKWTRSMESAPADELDAEQYAAWAAVKEYDSALSLLEGYARQENETAARATGSTAAHVAQVRRDLVTVGRSRGKVAHEEVPYMRYTKWPQTMLKIMSEVASSLK